MRAKLTAACCAADALGNRHGAETLEILIGGLSAELLRHPLVGLRAPDYLTSSIALLAVRIGFTRAAVYKSGMDDIYWYADATLVSDSHIYCSGSLAQCVRRWSRLSAAEQAGATVKLGSRTDGGQILTSDTVAALSRKPELNKV